MATLAAPIDAQADKAKSRATLAYRALLVFSVLYYLRPEDVIPGLDAIPIAKIVGGIALLGLVAGLSSGRAKTKFPLELKLLLILFGQLVLTIPFAFWRGGAFATVFEKFSKGVIVAMLVTLIIENFGQLRKLLFVQAASMCLTTVVSLILHRTYQGRLMGALGGIFENPNDLAINIAINWPLCLAFLLRSRNPIKRTFWAIGLLAMIFGVVQTYSRSGLLALVMALLVCCWEFGIRGRRFHLIAIAGMMGIVGLGVIVMTPHYTERIESIFGGNVHSSLDRGSWEARRELLVESIHEAIQNPLVGIGPGNFGAATGTWRVTHNTYTEFAAEAGFPAIILFLIILTLAFRNLRKVRGSTLYKKDMEVRVLSGALWASLAAYLIGAAFSSTEYELFPYFMMAYTSVLYRLVNTYIATPFKPDNIPFNSPPVDHSLYSPTQRIYAATR